MPILEILIRRLVRFGVRDVTLAVGHLASLLRAYFKDGERFDVRIDYSVEEEPLGTAGPLGLLRHLDAPFFVMNGDLLTDVDFSAMAETHRNAAAAATVGVFQRDIKVDLGVVEVDAASTVVRYIEKPVHRFLVSMGIYVLDPSVLRLIPTGRSFDLPDLVASLISSETKVTTYRHNGYWLDIGRPDDYEQAQRDLEQMRLSDTGDSQRNGI